MAELGTIRTTDLGQGWYASETVWGYTIGNPDKGQRIDLTIEEATRFVALYNQAEAEFRGKLADLAKTL